MLRSVASTAGFCADAGPNMVSKERKLKRQACVVCMALLSEVTEELT